VNYPFFYLWLESLVYIFPFFYLWCLGAFLKLRKATVNFVMCLSSVRPHTSAPTRRIFMKFDIWLVLFLFDNVIYVFLLLRLCILIVCLCVTTLTEGFPWFFLSCKANTRVKPTKTGHGPHSSKLLCCSMYFCIVLCIVCFMSFSVLFIYVCWTTATGWIPNCS
jgi:hypothetical protein